MGITVSACEESFVFGGVDSGVGSAESIDTGIGGGSGISSNI